MSVQYDVYLNLLYDLIAMRLIVSANLILMHFIKCIRTVN